MSLERIKAGFDPRVGTTFGSGGSKVLFVPRITRWSKRKVNQIWKSLK